VQLNDQNVFPMISRSVGGRALRKHLEEYLHQEDIISRKMRGDDLLVNTIKRQFISELIGCFDEPETLEKESAWKE